MSEALQAQADADTTRADDLSQVHPDDVHHAEVTAELAAALDAFEPEQASAERAAAEQAAAEKLAAEQAAVERAAAEKLAAEQAAAEQAAAEKLAAEQAAAEQDRKSTRLNYRH